VKNYGEKDLKEDIKIFAKYYEQLAFKHIR
jgi:hypothetical protein